MLERYTPNFAQLTHEQTQYLAAAMHRRSPSFIPNEVGEYESGEELMNHADAYGFDQAEIVMSLAQDATPMGTAIIETLIQPHQITRPAPGATSKTNDTSTARKTRTPRPPQHDPRVILTVQPNPKRKGSASAARYDLYKPGQTVQEAIAAGLTKGDIAHDTAKGFITLGAAQ